MRRQSVRTGEDIHNLRLDAGVSLRELGAATGIDPSHIGRIEAAKVQASIETLTALGVALGADLSLRFYPGTGPRIHDRFQAPMIESLLRQLHPRWQPRLEVPIPRPGRGVVDLMLGDPESRTTVIGEAQSEFHRIEEQLRWISQKADAIRDQLIDDGHDPGTITRLLVLRSTDATREIARRYRAILATAYPARSVDVVEALTGAGPWPGAGIVWVRIERGNATLLRHPPRGVPFGR